MLAHLKIIWQFHQKVSRFFGQRYIGDDFFLGPNLVSFNRAVVQNQIKKFYLKSVHFISVHKLSRAFQTDMLNKLHKLNTAQ